MYAGRLSGTTRTFRDPVEVDSSTRRRSSPGGPAGATRTFRDPVIRDVDLINPKKMSKGGGTTAASRKSVAATDRLGSSPPTNGRRGSLQEWLTMKTSTLAETEQLGGGTTKGEEERSMHHKQDPGFGFPGNGGYGGDETNPDHGSALGKIKLAFEDVLRVGGGSSGNLYERQGRKLPTLSDPPRGKNRDNVTGSYDPPLSKEELATQVDADAVIEDIYDSPVGDGMPRQVTFLSGTMGLTVDIGDPTQPQSPDKLRQHDEFPASPCSGTILETSPRYGSIQLFRKEMSCRGINAKV